MGGGGALERLAGCLSNDLGFDSVGRSSLLSLPFFCFFAVEVGGPSGGSLFFAPFGVGES